MQSVTTIRKALLGALTFPELLTVAGITVSGWNAPQYRAMILRDWNPIYAARVDEIIRAKLSKAMGGTNGRKRR